jgi:hypothetical protein
VIVLAWALSFGLMASTSTEVGSWFAEGQGHEIAQGYGLFMWAGVVLYATVGWRVWMRRNETYPGPLAGPLGEGEHALPARDRADSSNAAVGGMFARS